MRFFWRRRHKVEDTASYSSVNVWYGADDAPGVIDVDISSPVNVLDYYSYNAFNSVAYDTNRDGSGGDDGGKIEYVYVHADDDTFEDLSSQYQLEEEQKEGVDDDIVAEEAFGDDDEILEREEEEEKREESVGVVVVVVDAEVEGIEHMTKEEEKEEEKEKEGTRTKGRDYYTEFDDFINAVALEEEEEEEEEEREDGHANGENPEEEEEHARAHAQAMENEKTEEAKEGTQEESEKRESLKKRISSHHSATTMTRDVSEVSVRSVREEIEKRKRRGEEKENGGVFHNVNVFMKGISNDVNMSSLLRSVLLRDKWAIHFDGITSIRFRIDFTEENFRAWKRWTATRCSNISKWLQMRSRAAAASRRRHREEYIRSITKSPAKGKKEEGTPKKLLPFSSPRQREDGVTKKDINSPQSGMKAIDKAPNRSTPKSWKEKEEEALFKILNDRKKKEKNGRSNGAASSDETRTLQQSKMFKDKIARRATILLHICPPNK